MPNQPELPKCKKNELKLSKLELDEVLDLRVNSQLKDAQKRPASSQSHKRSDDDWNFNDVLDCVTEAASSFGNDLKGLANDLYDMASEKTSEWVESSDGLKGFLKNAREQIRRKVAVLDDYTTPIRKETQKALREICTSIQKKLDDK